MEKRMIEVLKPGLATSVQDLGRSGYQQLGMVVAGAMDHFALQIGNILVGNRRSAAGLEVVLMGPKLRFLKDTVIAICGADLSPTIDGKTIQLWKSYRLSEGQILSFGKPVTGSYAYIAVSGGIQTPRIMGSRSTYVKAKIGGLDGQYLVKGDVLPTGNPVLGCSGRQLHPNLVPDYDKPRRIRVILGPDDKSFTKQGIRTFLTGTYKKTSRTDRMGTRLIGPKITHAKGADIISDATFPGTIQVPANGQPIILLADRQPTGGYTRIATVITEDIPRLAQIQPGKELTFEAVSLGLAHNLYMRRERMLKLLSQVGQGVHP